MLLHKENHLIKYIFFLCHMFYVKLYLCKVVDDSTVFMIKVKTWAELLNTFCTSGKLELELMYKVQMQCYEDAKLMKLFPEIIRSLYDQDVLAEDTILHWFRKGTNTKGRYEIFPWTVVYGSKTVIYSFLILVSVIFPCSPTCYLLLLLIWNWYRQNFVKALEPFVNWLEEAEEEE